MAARSYYTDRRVALGLKVRIEEATSTFKLDTYNVRTNGDGKRAGDYLVPVLLTLVGVSSPSFPRKTPAFTPMGHGSLSPFGMHPYYCTLALPPPHSHTCDDWRAFRAESYVRHRGVFHPGNEYGVESRSLCPIFVDPARCVNLSCPQDRAPLPLACSGQSAVPDLGFWHGVERTTLTTLSRWACSLCLFSCTTIFHSCLVCCLPPAN